MNRIKYLLLFVAAALFLAACSTTDNGQTPGADTGSLKITVEGVASADVTVKKGSAEAWSGTVTGSTTRTLDVGTYTVTGAAASGYTAPSAQTVDVTKGGTAEVTLKYTANGNGDGPDVPDLEPGLYVTLFPFAARDADTTVTVYPYGDDEPAAPAANGEGQIYFDVPAGEYVVVAERAGFVTAEKEVDVDEDAATQTTVTLVAAGADGGPTENVDPNDPNAIKLSVVDEDGVSYRQHVDGPIFEENFAKNAELFAAQTEEFVCVTIQTVPFANIELDITSVIGNRVTWFRDACEDEVSGAATQGQLTADENGVASFSLYATDAWDIISIPGSNGAIFVSDVRSPAKVIVTARGADGKAALKEFKVFFVPMTHLLFGHGHDVDFDEDIDEPYDMVKAAVDAWLAGEPMDDDVYTGARWGREFEIQPNIWDTAGSNSHFFGTAAGYKQPINYGLGNVHEDFGGYMAYEIIGGDTDKVEWVDGEWCDLPDAANPELCIIDDYPAYAQLKPKSSVRLEDLQASGLSATVQATYFHEVQYGNFTYNFPLKSYTFTKKWIPAQLKIEKSVSQHVLTWFGEEHTLPATSDALTDNYLATVTITVTNDGEVAAKDVSITDLLPAELGVYEPTLEPEATYDAGKHGITWDYNTDADLQELAPGASIEVSFDVYARQKPGFLGFCEGEATGLIAPLYGICGDDDVGGPYPDPYLVVNGETQNSVAVTSRWVDDQGNASDQHVTSYQPVADEAHIWVVRPLFHIDKSLITDPPVVDERNVVQYEITVTNIDRLDNNEEAYEDLFEWYPWEFGLDEVGSLNQPDDYSVRNNPYARDIAILDEFEDGLDFTDADNFDVADGAHQPSDDDQATSWKDLNELERGQQAHTRLTLTAQVPSAEGAELNEAGEWQPTGEVLNEDDAVEPGWWQNCAYLAAPQLNQPGTPGGTSYSEPLPWTQFMVEGEIEGTASTAGGIGEMYQFTDRNYISDCANVIVLPLPPQIASLSLTTNGEYNQAPVNGEPDREALDDGYVVGDNFWYVLTAQNSGQGAATNVVFVADLDFTDAGNNDVRINFDGTARIYIGDVTGPWTQRGTKALSGGAVNVGFDPITVPAGKYMRVVLPATVVQGPDSDEIGGTVDLNATVTYDDGVSTGVEKHVQEQTTVNRVAP